MKVSVMFLGPLGMQIGKDPIEIELPDGSTYGVLMETIGRRYGKKFIDGIWDPQNNAFKGTVLTIGSGRDLRSPGTPLLQKEEIKFVPIFAGG